ncbi:MAG: 4Fe-4S dicluster domain-containing protein [Cytophagaceae bacterium]|nr:4Fe-4S dicluster domain-containing protein [Cytophagaceae bacterium]
MENNEQERRDFLKNSLGILGASVLGGGLISQLTSCTKEDGKEKVQVMTVDGNLVMIDKSEIKDFQYKLTTEAVRTGIPGKKFVMVIDLAKCDGCGKCTEACNKMHYLPKDKEWIEVLKMDDSPNTAPYYFPKPCFHCDNPPCTKVCPVDATFKREDGVVAIDNDRCIGCRFCMAACPYSVRLFNWEEPKAPELEDVTPSSERAFQSKKGCVEKCDFCPHMARQGKLPACVTGCPMNAIYFGDENENAVTNQAGETENFLQLLEDRAAYRFMEELGTDPRVYYLPPYKRLYPKPEITEETRS